MLAKDQMRKLQVRNYSSQPLQTSHQPVAPDTSSSSEGVSFTEVNEFPPADGKKEIAQLNAEYRAIR